MPYKLCPGCRKMSYAAGSIKEWYCPYCGDDISDTPPLKKQHETESRRILQECYYLSAFYDQENRENRN